MTTATIQGCIASFLAGLPPEEIPDAVQALRETIHGFSPWKSHPVDLVRWEPVAKVCPNDYNPNAVARVEMALLKRSIDADGYTQPVVTVADPAAGRRVIVDGFHRYLTCRNNPDIQERTAGGFVPTVLLDKPLADRIASTVRHNRARGTHSVTGMSKLVFDMLSEGKSDAEILRDLGMEPDELQRLKHITGFAILFKDSEYSPAWVNSKALERANAAGIPVHGDPGAESAPPPVAAGRGKALGELSEGGER